MDKSAIAFRLLVAAAWSDGELHPTEALLLSQYLLRLQLGENERFEMLEYLRLRPAADTSRLWLDEVMRSKSEPGERRELLQALELIIRADGRLVEQELLLRTQLHEALEADGPASLLGRFKRWLGRVVWGESGRPAD